jgi:hypothetical protein
MIASEKRSAAIKMERFDSNVSSLQAALEKRPEVFDAVGVDFSAYIFLIMVDGLVNEILRLQFVIACPRIGVKSGLLFDLIQDFVLKVSRLTLGITFART